MCQLLHSAPCPPPETLQNTWQTEEVCEGVAGAKHRGQAGERDGAWATADSPNSRIRRGRRGLWIDLGLVSRAPGSGHQADLGTWPFSLSVTVLQPSANTTFACLDSRVPCPSLALSLSGGVLHLGQDSPLLGALCSHACPGLEGLGLDSKGAAAGLFP